MGEGDRGEEHERSHGIGNAGEPRAISGVILHAMHRKLGVLLALCFAAFPSLAAVTGVVMTNDGKPVAGARVSLVASETGDARRARLLSAAPEPVPLTSAETDAKGAFSLESPKEPVVQLRITARGYEPLTRSVERDEEAGAIVLAKAEPRGGKISNGGGQPIAGATVVLTYGSGELAVRTDEQGRYEAPDPKRLRSIAVLHPDYAIDTKSFAMTGATVAAPELNRTLSTGVKHTGRVVGADGQTAVAQATLLLDGWPVATTGDDGTFTIAHAPSRWTQIMARKDALLATRAWAANQHDHTLKLEKGATLTGRVTDAKTKMPVAGASVRVGARRFFGLDSGNTVFTDAKGTYSIVVPAGSHVLFANHPAYELKDVDAGAVAGQVTSKDVQVTPLARVSGTVLDEERRPVVAAVLSSENVDEGMMMRGPMRMFRMDDPAVSGPDGRFTIRVASESDLHVRAKKRGMPMVRSDRLRLAPGERKGGVVLTIPTGIAVSGRVTDQGGEPLSGVAVTATEAEPGGRMMMMRTIITGMPGRDEDVVRTGSDGSFTMRVKEGTYDFQFRREGYAPKSVRGQSVSLAASPAVDTTMEPAVEISGRVTRKGAAIEGVRVNVFAMGSEAGAVTGPDGSFTLTGLAPGNMRLSLRKEDEFIQETRTVTAPVRDLVIDLPVGGRVTGRVVEKGTKKAITTFQAGVTTSRSGGGIVMMGPPQLRDFTSEDGSFTLENVPSGAMTLVASAPGYASGRLNVEIEEGKTTSGVEVELDTGVRLVGKVTGPNGAAVADATVRVAPSPTGGFALSGNERGTLTDSNGEYTLEGLEAGEETIMFTHARHVATRKDVTLKGRETRLDVQLSGGQRLTGTVVTEAGAPVPEATVDAMVAGSGMQTARSDANGNFSFESLAPGRYRFSARKSGLADGMLEDVDVATAGNVRIVMRTGGTLYGRVTGLTPQELAEVQVEARAGRSGATAAVDAAGNYRLEGAPTGTVTVGARLMSRATMVSRASGTETVELAPGGSQQVDLQFRSDVVVRGKVVRDGVPMASANVMFTPRGGMSRAFAAASTDEQGNYSISGLEDGEYSVSVTDMQRLSPFQTTYRVNGSGTFDIDYKTGGLRGRVIDAGTGEPVGSASVQLRSTNTSSDAIRISRGAITDNNGTFAFDAVPAGQYLATVSGDGYGNVVQDLQVGTQGMDNLELKLSRNEGVTLKVVDARDGHALNGSVFVYDLQGRLVYETRMFFGGGAADTSAVKLPLAAGSYQAWVTAGDYAGRNITLQSPSTPPAVALTPGGTIVVQSKHSQRMRMRLIDSNGLPYPRYGSMPGARDLAPSPGTTPLLYVAAGTYTLQLIAADSEAVLDSQQVVVNEGGTTRVDL